VRAHAPAWNDTGRGKGLWTDNEPTFANASSLWAALPLIWFASAMSRAITQRLASQVPAVFDQHLSPPGNWLCPNAM